MDVEGFRVLVDPALTQMSERWRRTRAALLFDLGLVAERLPATALEGVRQTPIVVTLSTPPRPDWDGSSAACLHVSEGWLLSHGYDADRAGVVEILHAEKYLLWRAEQPMMLLHELAHAHHLALGYDEPRIASAFEEAMERGLYDAVAYIMAPDAPGRRAYAATNPQEYFAELTEAYFGRNDYYPFTREDLRQHDPEGLAVVEGVWGVEPTP